MCEKTLLTQKAYQPLILLDAVHEEYYSSKRDGACQGECGWTSNAHAGNCDGWMA